MAGNDSFTKLLLHCNGADESTTFTDESIGGGHGDATAEGTAQVDTAQKKFGTGSLLLDGNSDYITFGDDNDWDFSNGSFTLDCWVRFNNLPTDGNSAWIIDQSTDGNNYWGMYVANSGGSYSLYFREIVSGSPTVSLGQGLGTFSTGTWYHLAIVRSGNSWYHFKDGTQIGTTQTDSTTLTAQNILLAIGNDPSAADRFFDGWIDEIRVSKGTARWTSNFSVPTSEYSETSAARILYLGD